MYQRLLLIESRKAALAALAALEKPEVSSSVRAVGSPAVMMGTEPSPEKKTKKKTTKKK